MSFFGSLVGAAPYFAQVIEADRQRKRQAVADKLVQDRADQAAKQQQFENVLKARALGGSILPQGVDPKQALGRLTAGNMLRSIGAETGGAVGIPSDSAPDLYGSPELTSVNGMNILFDPSKSPEAMLERRQGLTQAAADRRATRAQTAAAALETQREKAAAEGRQPVVIMQGGKRVYSKPSDAIGKEAPAPAAARQGIGGGAMTMQRVLTLQGHFNTDQTVKDAQQIATAYQKIKGAATGAHTPTNDMSLVYGLMKMQDPNSTVREGEYATAENAANVPARIRDSYNLAIKNHLLPDETRQQFLATAESIARAQRSVFEGTRKRYSDFATRQGVNPLDVVYDPYDGIFDAAPASPTGAGRGGGRGGTPNAGDIDLRSPGTQNGKTPTYEEWKKSQGIP